MTQSVGLAEMDVSSAHPMPPDGQHASAAVEDVITSVSYIEAESNSGSGSAFSTMFNHPEGVVVAGDGTLFVSEYNGHRVRKVTPDGQRFTVAGDGTEGDGGDGGPATAAQLRWPGGLALDAGGNLFIADLYRVRKVTPDGVITTAVDSLNCPVGLAFDSAGNLYIAERDRHRVQKMAPDGTITTVVGSGGSLGRYEYGFSGDNGHAADALLSSPRGLCVDGDDNLYIADSGNNRVRKVDRDGIITTVAGTGQARFGGDGGQATEALLDCPHGLARDIYGNLYIADRGNHRVRKVDRDGVVTTVAGTGQDVSGGDGGQAEQAGLQSPYGLAMDPCGNLCIADGYGYRVRKISGPQERSMVIRQVKVPQAGLGEIAELTVEITARRPGQAVDAKTVVQTFTAPTGFAFAQWPTYSYNGDDAWKGSLSSRFERGRRVMVVTSGLHLNTRAGDKGPLVYTIPVEAVDAVDPGTYHDGQLLVGRHPGIRLSATVTTGPRFAVTPSWPPQKLARDGSDSRYPGVEVRREGEAPAQIITVTLPPGAGLAFKPEGGERHLMTVLSHSTVEKRYEAELSDDGQTLTCRNVDLGLSQQHPLSAVWVAVTATTTATVGSTHLTFRVGGIESASTTVEVTEG
ncbi:MULTISPECIES: NHL repeat-containing protein [unclassified Streptomyces]|uniref:NHL repeat-containing protein n=1 Tax=unclassified Streptomyces TaxID=2593676 RepID=UPI0038138346